MSLFVETMRKERAGRRWVVLDGDQPRGQRWGSTEEKVQVGEPLGLW